METIQTLTIMYELLPFMVIGIFIITLITCCIIGTINNKENEKIKILLDINQRIISIQQNTYKKSDN